MTSYRLHYFPESGNSYKLALMLTLCGEAFEPVWTDFGGGVTRTPEWRASVNEMGEIPVLEENGRRRTQTAVILLPARRASTPSSGAKARRRRDEVLRWLFWDNHKLTGHVATYRFMRTFTQTPDPAGPEILICGASRILLGILDGHLGDRAFVVGDRPTIADISMIAYLSYPENETGFDLAATRPAIHAWLGRVAQLPGWRPPYELLPGKRLVHYA